MTAEQNEGSSPIESNVLDETTKTNQVVEKNEPLHENTNETAVIQAERVQIIGTSDYNNSNNLNVEIEVSEF